MLVLFSIMLR
ncbi:hypothetical protein MTR67_038375 [Solanum verrucosum]|uniref:Uncharacterized protein n=1 Tax=Solanum verrucosum TaxID=315347 RepID=A0AAF0ZPL4_SOLVR|nr:hypothetical protein MTR67_038375 [Solanum verrucosum]